MILFKVVVLNVVYLLEIHVLPLKTTATYLCNLLPHGCAPGEGRLPTSAVIAINPSLVSGSSDCSFLLEIVA